MGTVILSVLVLVAAGAYWHQQGGRWYVVTSPSMGEVMPTGSLLLTRPTTLDEVAPGDLVTFRSPGSRSVFTHRVVDRTPQGLTTRGDVNLAHDAWTITNDDLIGEVTWHAPILGWVLRGVPLLFAGVAITWLLTMLVTPSRRYGLRLVGSSATVAGVSWLLRPWVGLDQLSQTTPNDSSSGVLMEVISTGLLPIRAYEIDGTTGSTLHNGQVSTLHLTHLTQGRYDVSARLSITWWGWVLIVLIVLAPLLWSSLRGLPPLPGVAAGDLSDERSDELCGEGHSRQDPHRQQDHRISLHTSPQTSPHANDRATPAVGSGRDCTTPRLVEPPARTLS